MYVCSLFDIRVYLFYSSVRFIVLYCMYVCMYVCMYACMYVCTGNLADVFEMRYGSGCTRFIHYNRSKKKPWLAFSLVFKDRTLDLVCQNERQVSIGCLLHTYIHTYICVYIDIYTYRYIHTYISIHDYCDSACLLSFFVFASYHLCCLYHINALIHSYNTTIIHTIIHYSRWITGSLAFKV